MNGFVLMLRHTLDDMPVGLFQTYRDALIAAENRDWDLTANEEDIFAFDATTPNNMAVIEFKDGAPVKMTIVRYAE
jgi:hypothetical protein